jgi:hypothetical protein
MGANRAFIENYLPELPCLLTKSRRDFLRACEVIVLAGNHPEFADLLRGLERRHILIDLVRLPLSATPAGARVEGLCW